MSRAKPRQLERAEGRALMLMVNGRWWGPMLHHSPNEEMNPIARQIAAGQGTRPGFPDYVLYLRNEWHPGLAFELKAPRPFGKPASPAQRAWLEWFAAQGWQTGVCFGAEEALALLDAYTATARRLAPAALAIG